MKAGSAQAGEPATDAEAGSVADRLEALRRKVARWQARFEGKQFLLPPQKAVNLMKTRDEYLAGSR